MFSFELLHVYQRCILPQTCLSAGATASRSWGANLRNWDIWGGEAPSGALMILLASLEGELRLLWLPPACGWRFRRLLRQAVLPTTALGRMPELVADAVCSLVVRLIDVPVVWTEAEHHLRTNTRAMMMMISMRMNAMSFFRLLVIRYLLAVTSQRLLRWRTPVRRAGARSPTLR